MKTIKMNEADVLALTTGILKEKDRKLKIAIEALKHYAGIPFATNDVYLDIFDLFKIESTSVTSFDAEEFKKVALEALEAISDE